jgi:thiol-disulfide isomerase/thioredoxin
MNHKNRAPAIILFLAITVSSLLSAAQGQGLTSFTAQDLQGNTVDQSVFSPYKLTMINIWATFCSPCLQEMPALAELRTEYQPKGVNIIGIVTDVDHPNKTVFQRNLQTAQRIITQTKADYIHLLPSTDLREAKLNYVQAVPETFFVDNKGNIVGKSYIGARSKSAWKVIIENTLTALR